MTNELFQFKQFSVDHHGCAMKVGTDGVLLGCWTCVDNASNILDIGTGCGLIALMMAQRTPPGSRITGVEILEKDSAVARNNVANSPWPEKVAIHNVAVQDFNPGEKYDLIVSNPPFFVNSFQPPDLRRMNARHTHALSFPDLLRSADRLLTPGGKLSVILPTVEATVFREAALEYGLHCSRLWSFRPRVGKPVERLLMEFTRTKAEPETGEIIMYANGNEWTEEFKELSRDFYLKL